MKYLAVVLALLAQNAYGYLSVNVSSSVNTRLDIQVQVSANVYPNTSVSVYQEIDDKIEFQCADDVIKAVRTVGASASASVYITGRADASADGRATVSGNSRCNARSSDGDSGYDTDYINDSGYDRRTNSYNISGSDSGNGYDLIDVELAKATGAELESAGFGLDMEACQVSRGGTTLETDEDILAAIRLAQATGHFQ